MGNVLLFCHTDKLWNFDDDVCFHCTQVMELHYITFTLHDFPQEIPRALL